MFALKNTYVPRLYGTILRYTLIFKKSLNRISLAMVIKIINRFPDLAHRDRKATALVTLCEYKRDLFGSPPQGILEHSEVAPHSTFWEGIGRRNIVSFAWHTRSQSMYAYMCQIGT